MLLILCVFLQSVYQPTNAPHKTQFMMTAKACGSLTLVKNCVLLGKFVHRCIGCMSYGICMEKMHCLCTHIACNVLSQQRSA